MSGKGSAPRPISVPDDEYAESWERIFGKTQEPERTDADPE
jgi:hypothetical protein